MVFDNVKVNVGSVAVWPFKMAMVTFEADNSSCALFAPDDENATNMVSRSLVFPAVIFHSRRIL